MSDKPEHNKLDTDCTLPPDHPLPADQLGRYSPERDFYAEKEIAEYLEGQARGEETVQNVERVKTEYVIGRTSARTKTAGGSSPTQPTSIPRSTFQASTIRSRFTSG